MSLSIAPSAPAAVSPYPNSMPPEEQEFRSGIRAMGEVLSVGYQNILRDIAKANVAERHMQKSLENRVKGDELMKESAELRATAAELRAKGDEHRQRSQELAAKAAGHFAEAAKMKENIDAEKQALAAKQQEIARVKAILAARQAARAQAYQPGAPAVHAMHRPAPGSPPKA